MCGLKETYETVEQMIDFLHPMIIISSQILFSSSRRTGAKLFYGHEFKDKKTKHKPLSFVQKPCSTKKYFPRTLKIQALDKASPRGYLRIWTPSGIKLGCNNKGQILHLLEQYQANMKKTILPLYLLAFQNFRGCCSQKISKTSNILQKGCYKSGQKCHF